MNETYVKTLILVGGGHAHLYLIKQMRTDQLKNHQVFLISAGKKQYYSGMASSYLEGLYSEKDFSVDLMKLCEKSGVTYIEDEVVLIQPKDKTIVTRNGVTFTYDILSLDTGSDVVGKQIPGANAFSHLVKPLHHLVQIKKVIQEVKQSLFKVVFIGAGAAGVEMALAIHQLALQMNKNIQILMIDSGNGILKGYPEKVKLKMKIALMGANIQVLQNERVHKIEKKQLLLKSEKRISYDFLIVAAGSVAHPLYRQSGLDVDERGYMFVNGYLQNKDYPDIFGAGDCIAFTEYDYVRKIGVYAIKEAPILWENIKRKARGDLLKKYKPQKKYLSIVTLGNRRGILSYNKMVFTGKWPWYLKDWIDRRFINRYQ
ncbi:FAD-dependent oxidoreductase [Petrocella sp. FN5]|uniref:FAD-dependent oxidoreductase n=1 Tax=Petrocella sp. FN5 TaxID=3032002 RepID=UPI0023DC2F1D|nr:FAD-dependent oxidoreductase [Petrocella sp. FN5]MDF1618746.1 FAD-dependent oxidoreductase [Petrocella sp. FN5]